MTSRGFLALAAVAWLALLLSGSWATASGPAYTGTSAAVPPEWRCPDGRIPINSPAVRCTDSRQPRLQWAGRKCDNASRSDFGCPWGYTCLSEGVCCQTPEPPHYQGSLCRLQSHGSQAVETGGSCARHSDCTASLSGTQSQCCAGTCVLLVQRCYRMQQQFMSLLSTGKLPRLYMPICTYDGAFAPVQWEPRFNLRWCVDRRTGLAQRGGGCCQSDFASGVLPLCPGMRPCPRDLCAMRRCPARPDARCRVDACRDCRVDFVDPATGQPVDCRAGLSQCEAQADAYYEGLYRLRARDQTQWLQTDEANKPVSDESNLARYMDTCQADTCVPYDASKLEASSSSSASSSMGYGGYGGYGTGYGGGYGESCPQMSQLNYRCRDRCTIFSGCSAGQVCCNSGCGLECMTPSDIHHEAHCAMSISSGHCPAVGCHRMCRRWGYDTATRRCRAFWYAGSGGNNNRYGSWAECEWRAQNCHGRVLIALPVRPNCLPRSHHHPWSSGGHDDDGKFDSVQRSDNGMFWCVDREGRPTPGTLHADSIRCTRAGRLIKNKYYRKVSVLYQAKCEDGSWPAWCHNITLNGACGSPGVTTFADACDNCRLVHVNAEGERVACQTDAKVCSSGTVAPAAAQTKATKPTFRYSPADGRCHLQYGGGGGGAFYSRESGCLRACGSGWCGNASVTAFYPDLCVAPACRLAGAVCVPDECAGRERYFLPNGSEAVECARQLEPLSLTGLVGCGGGTTASTASTPKSTSTSTPKLTSTPTSTTSATTRTTAAKTAAVTATSTTNPIERGQTTPANYQATSGPRTTGSTQKPNAPITTAGRNAAAATTSSDSAAQKSSTTTTKLTTVPTTTTAPSTTTSIPSTATTTPTEPPPKTILPICLIRRHLGVEIFKCRASDGKYDPRQCNLTHCFCVVVDTGAPVPGVEAVPLARGATLSCPVLETTNLSVSITYDANYMSVLPTMEDEALLQKAVLRRFGYEAGLQARHFGLVDLEPGSILVGVNMQKAAGDSSVDLPASSFELKTMALKQTLTIDFKGATLTPSTRQDFNEKLVSSVVEPPAALKANGGAGGNGGSELNVTGIVAGVLITVVLVAVCGVLIAFALRRRALHGDATLPHESGDYETMSNASQSTGPNGSSHQDAYDNFTNKVYGPVEDVYDNIAQPASTA